MHDGTSRNGFVWPLEGPVEAPDWRATDPHPHLGPSCGNGLHGWLWGQGNEDDSAYSRDPEALWQVVDVETEDGFVRLHGGKVKFRRGVVVKSGPRHEVVPWLMERAPADTAGIHFKKISKEDYACVAVGDYGEAIATGDCSCAVAGTYGRAAVGFAGVAVARYGGTAIAGGDGRTFASGSGTAIGLGTASAKANGRCGVVLVGHGWASAGEGGVLISVTFPDGPHVAVAYVGEDGIKPDTMYRYDTFSEKWTENPEGDGQ